MEVLCIGDPHFKSDNGEETLEMTHKISKIILEKKPNIVVVLGDILHRHEKIDLHPLYRSISFLEKIHQSLMEYEGFLYILIGNHDRSNNGVYMTDEHAFNPLKKWKNTYVADKVLNHVTEKFNNIICPYVSPGRLVEAISTIDNMTYIKDGILTYSDFFKDKVNMVFAHQEFEGAKMNMITSNCGDKWDSSLPLCVSGHIHDYQLLQSNLIYTGTPIQHGFADTTRKTISYFKVNLDVKLSFTEERINLGIKGKRQFNIKVEDFNENLSKYIDLSKDFYVKIKLIGTKKSIKDLTKSPEYKIISINDNIKINFLELEETSSTYVNKDIQPLISFRERIQKELLNYPDMKDVFNKIFC